MCAAERFYTEELKNLTRTGKSVATVAKYGIPKLANSNTKTPQRCVNITVLKMQENLRREINNSKKEEHMSRLSS